MTAPHSELGASGAYRWMICLGCVLLSRGMLKTSSQYAKEGNAAHSLAERCLRSGKPASDYFGEEITIEGEAFAVDEDMVDAVQKYSDTIAQDRKEGDEIAIEQHFDLAKFYPGLYGTNDCSIYRSSTGGLIVYDFKYGRGVAVDVVHNLQLMYYALGAATAKPNRRLTSVVLVIVQPRCAHPDGPVRRWEISPLDLLEWSGDLVNAAKATQQPNAPLKAGKHCKFCPAIPKCPALRKHVLDTARADFSNPKEPILPNPESINQKDLAFILGEAGLIEDWVRKIKEYAHHEAESGREIPGYKLVAKRAVRSWQNEKVTYQRLIEHGCDKTNLYQTPKIKSPAQIEKTIGKKEMKLFSDLVLKKSSGTTLVEASDSRPAISSSAQTDFTGTSVPPATPQP